MRLCRVEIKNFRNFLHLTVDPFPANAVIVGVNGAGKSNLLDAMRLVLDPSLPHRARYLQETDICESSGMTLNDPDLEVSVDLRFTDFEGDDILVGQLDGCIISTDPMVAQVTYSWRRSQFPQDDAGKVAPAKVADFEWRVYGAGVRDFDVSRLRRDLPLTVLPALRDAVRDLEALRDNPLSALIAAKPPEAASITKALAEIAAATDALALDSSLTSIGHDVSSRLQNMAGQHMQVDPTLGFSPGRPDSLIRALRLFIDSVRARSVADTSTGSANVIYLALLLQRLEYSKANEEFLVPFLAVEEPEAHLHPSLQRQLFGYLLNRHSPLILTTHSPHIAAVARVERFVMLKPSPTVGTTGTTISGAGLSEQDCRDLNRYLDVTRAEVLFAGTVLLVEGITELFLMTAIARIFDFDLEAWGVVVTSVAGVDFQPLHRLLGTNGLDVPHVVITDGDGDVEDGYQGLARAAALLEPNGGPVTEGVSLARQAPDEDHDLGHVEASAAAAGVFVGKFTLEIDLCLLLGPEIEQALVLQGRRASLVKARIKGVVETPTASARAELLKSVGGKGSLGQRFAEVLSGLTLPALLERMQVSTWGELLSEAGDGAYVLSALDYVSQRVGRGPLMSVSDASSSAAGSPS